MSALPAPASIPFDLPVELAAAMPPEARGLRRDEVRLMVSRAGDDALTHTRFVRIPDFLEAGDVLVVNTSATINAALPAARSGEPVMLHLSTPLSEGEWVVELRRVSGAGTEPLLTAGAGETVHLAGGGTAQLMAPYRGSARLWIAELRIPGDVLSYAARFGSPIRYDYVREEWPLGCYQTMFAREPGSAEMPSAGRPFTPEVVRGLGDRGIRVVPIVLHAGVSSLELGEDPYPERYRVPRETALAVNDARAAGGRVVAVGTTTVRALETVASGDGVVAPGAGWTELVVTPERRLRAVDGLLTGLHAPNASHLAMLEALAGREHVAAAYAAALERGYLWHEFGDVHLLLA